MCEHKLGKVESDGYQYCVHCGLGIVSECKHNFSHYDTRNIEQDKRTTAADYILKCLKCGEMKTYRVSIDKAGYI